MMEYKSAEQAAEEAKGLTFEKVWAALQDSHRRMEEDRIKSQEKYEKEMAELRRELNKSIGGIGDSFGRFTEGMYNAGLLKKFRKCGFSFSKQANNAKYYKDNKIIAEIDSILENGEYVMLVEIKVELSIRDVNEHIKRISVIRQYMDERDDARKIVGAVAGGTVPEEVVKYAQGKGLYVIVQSGAVAKIADAPDGFKAQEF